MFCPLCGVALSRAVETCSGCRTDLRPLYTSGVFSTQTPVPVRRQDADEVTRSATGADVTGLGEELTVGAAPALRDDELTVGPDSELTVTAAPALPDADLTTVLGTLPGMDDPDVTRADGPGAPRPGSDSEARRRTLPPRRSPSSGGGTKPPRTGGTKPPRTGGAAAGEGPLQIGELLGTRYHIIRMLGVGGMGAVYQAWDSELEVALAFKVIRPDAIGDPVAAAAVEARFKRELLLARQVTHPNVVRIHDLGEIDGMKYITMPYVEGRDLFDILAESKTLPIPRVLNIAKQVASGLAAAHRAGVVHRDLKPANIMLEADDRALIMDFGIARGTTDTVEKSSPEGLLTRRNSSADETRVGTVVGTIEYMAPEQARAEAVDQRVDIYAFGLIMYRMIVGRRFAEGATDAYSDLMARMKEEPTRLREVDPTVPDAVEQIVSKCLQPDPAARYQTTDALLEALERLDENGIPLPEPIPVWRSWRFWSAAAVLTLLIVGGTWWFAQLFAPEVPVVHEPVSVLIADFANGTGDAMFDGILEQSLGVAVEGASFVTAYERRSALRVAAQLKAGKTLDEKVARVVAQREGVKIVLAGGIVPDGSGYRLSVRGINPADGSPTLSTEVRASNKNDVLTAVGRLGADIRKSLGDTKTARTPAANEMLSASSLEAVAEYIKGQELTRQARDEEGIAYFKRATEIDPNFGRAYSAWGTAAFKIGRSDEAEAQYKKALSLLNLMTKREQYRTLGAYYLARGNYLKAIDNYQMLVDEFPSDASAYNNLAVAWTNTRDLRKASENGRKALAIYPRNLLYRSNYALYALYAGDFTASANEAKNVLKEDPNFLTAYFTLAMTALARGEPDVARDFYQKVAGINARGASLANIGLADIAIVEGRAEEAIRLLNEGIAADDAAKNEAGATVKRMAVAETFELEGDLRAAVAGATGAVATLKTDPILVPASRIFAAARQQRDIDATVKILANQFEPQRRAYGRIVDALDYMSRERYVDAVDSLNAAKGFADLWLARFYLGVAYQTAGRHTEAISELLACHNRRGEAMSLFMDEVPTYRYLAPLPYWLARAQEGTGQIAQAKANYEAFLAQKKGPTKDPLVADARQRLALLPAR